MATTFVSAFADKQHPLSQQLRSVLNNPNASLGELAAVVQRTMGELKLFEEQSEQQRKQRAEDRINGPLAGMSNEEIDALRSLISSMTSPSKRAGKSR